MYMRMYDHVMFMQPSISLPTKGGPVPTKAADEQSKEVVQSGSIPVSMTIPLHTPSTSVPEPADLSREEQRMRGVEHLSR